MIITFAVNNQQSTACAILMCKDILCSVYFFPFLSLSANCRPFPYRCQLLLLVSARRLFPHKPNGYIKHRIGKTSGSSPTLACYHCSGQKVVDLQSPSESGVANLEAAECNNIPEHDNFAPACLLSLNPAGQWHKAYHINPPDRWFTSWLTHFSHKSMAVAK